ncbi:MAG: ATPase [Clostridia bacterium]|nr:ATPase [Clostridia bacterium]
MSITIAKKIADGKTFLGIELGSTRIKAVLTDENGLPLASGAFDWENRLVDGIWTYGQDEILRGVRACYADLRKNVKKEYGVVLRSVMAMGVSAMMHGYLAFDKAGELLVPFRTWRNTCALAASQELSALFDFKIPARWSIAHLYRAIKEGEPHVEKIAYLTTLAGYIHYLLTGERVLGVGDASGMFPIDSETMDYDEGMLLKFDALIAEKRYPWKLKEILPRVLRAGEYAGKLTAEGAALLDETGALQAGIPLCPPEGDAGTGMVATDAVAPRTGNVSAGTSVFTMAVLDRPLKGWYPEIDVVATPDGAPVAMVHGNNCTGDIDAWIRLFGETLSLFGDEVKKSELYDKLLKAAFDGDKDVGGLMNYNYIAGEGVTKIPTGKPMFLRGENCSFNIANFMKAQLFGAVATIRVGMDILYREGVKLECIAGHGGYFKTKETGTRFMSAALGIPVKVMETAGEGGPWGMALLASYLINKKDGETLPQYLENRIFAGAASETVSPLPEDIESFGIFLERYKKWLPAEAEAGKI